MTFLPHPYYLNTDDMAKFILAIPTTGWTWKPIGITWHHPGGPPLTQGDAYPSAVKSAWGANLDHYYKVDEGWHAGPHFAGTPDNAFVLSEPRANGVHASCFNADHFGVETVGDFRTGSDNPLTTRGFASMQSSANIIAALCKRMGWEPHRVINFHRDCPKDGHPCPGNLVTDDWAISLVEARLDVLNAKIGPPAPLPVPATPGAAASKALQEAVMTFQQAAGLVVDGDFGPLTLTAYERGLR
jgi:hypothetical protein